MISHINWDVTSNCNCNCHYCGAHQNYKDLSSASMMRIAKNIVDLGAKTVTIAGGEPFLRKDLFKILRILKDHSLTVIILTNGTLIRDEEVKNLVKHSVDGVRISLDFASPIEFNSSRGGYGLFDRVNYAVNELVSHDIIVGINGTIFHENFKEITGIMDYAIEHKCKFVRFMPISYIGRAKYKPYRPDIYSQTLREIISQVARRKESFTNLGFSQLPKNIKDFAQFSIATCPAGTQSLNIAPDGSVKLCPLLPKQGMNLSALKLDRCISLLPEMLHEVFQIDALEGKCKKCILKNLCRGGCPANKVSKGLCFSAAQPICIIDLIEEALSDIWMDPEVRAVLSDIYMRMSLTPNTCFRSLPLWIHFIRTV